MTKERMIELAQAQLDAYNKGDIEAFCKCYHPQVQAYDLQAGTTLYTNIEDFRKGYGERFKQNPELHCQLNSRTVLPNSVIDEELVTGVVGRNEVMHVAAIYAFKDNLISQVWFSR